MAFLFFKKSDRTWYIVDKSDLANPWKRLGRDRLEIDKAGARAAFEHYEKDSNYLRLGLPRNDDEMTFAELIPGFLDGRRHRVTSNTLRVDQGHLNLLALTFGKRSIETITADEVEKYLNEKNYNPNTRRNVVTVLRKLYDYAIEKKILQPPSPGAVAQNPMRALRVPRSERALPRPVDDWALKAILEALGGRLKDYYSLILHSGMRPGEAKKLQVKHGTSQGILLEKTKTKTQRIVPWTTQSKEIFQRLSRGKKRDSFLFPSEGGHQENFKDGLKRAVDRANKKIIEEAKKSKIKDPILIPHTTPNQLRHTFATMVLKKTGKLKHVSRLLGHASISTTEIYAKVIQEDLEDAVLETFG